MIVSSPRTDPNSWQRIELPTRLRGTFVCPPRDGLGAVTVTGKGVGRKLERQKPAGKNKGKLVDKGIEGASGTIKIQYDARYWDLAEAQASMAAMVEALHPRGPEAGGPIEAKHGYFATHQIEAIKIEEIDGPTWTGYLGEVTLNWQEVDRVAQKETGKGSVKTDKDVVQWEHAKTGKAAFIGPPEAPLVPVENADGTTTAVRSDRVRGFDNPNESPQNVPEGFVP